MTFHYLISFITVEPRIDPLAMQDITVRVGQHINFTVPFEASPTPKAKWEINHKDVGYDSRIDISTSATETVLDIPFAVRSDCGVYKLTLINDLGSCTATANVTVLGIMIFTILFPVKK